MDSWRKMRKCGNITMKVKTNMSLSPYYNQLLLVLTAALVGAAVGAVDAVFGKILLAI